MTIVMDQFEQHVALAPYTTFQIGGKAEYFAVADSIERLQSLLKVAQAAEQPVTILGGGSNVLVADRGIAGCVILMRITGRSYVEQKDIVYATFGAGEVFDEIVTETCAHGYWGLENLSHIPGSVGATPIQNVGAYGVEIADVCTSVQAIHGETGEVRTFTPDACAFAYRYSFFKTDAGRSWIVTAVTFGLTSEDNPQLSYADLTTRLGDVSNLTPARVRAEIIDIRSHKFPDWSTVGTAGSFFKNPIIPSAQYDILQAQYPELPGYPTDNGMVKVPLGWILDKVCNLRGYTHETVGTYEGQALVVVNRGGATAAAVETFATDIAATVQAATNITIEWEVTRLDGRNLS